MNEKNGSLFKAFFAFLPSLLFNFVNTSLIKRLGLQKIFEKVEFSKLKIAFSLFVLLLSVCKVSFSQNAPAGQDKYYMLVGELLDNNLARTDVYPYTTGGGITSCSLPGVPSLDDEENPELTDFRRRFWLTLPLSVAVLVLAMAGHYANSPTCMTRGAAWPATPIRLRRT